MKKIVRVVEDIDVQKHLQKRQLLKQYEKACNYLTG